jgi:hypothetical protein
VLENQQRMPTKETAMATCVEIIGNIKAHVRKINCECVASIFLSEDCVQCWTSVSTLIP